MKGRHGSMRSDGPPNKPSEGCEHLVVMWDPCAHRIGGECVGVFYCAQCGQVGDVDTIWNRKWDRGE